MSEYHPHDLVSRQIEVVGGATLRKLKRLRADADASTGPDTPAFKAFTSFHDGWRDGTAVDHQRMVREAEAEENVA